MKLKLLLIFLMIYQVTSYYFYNKETKQVISKPTLNIPNGFRIIQPPKTLKFDKAKFTSGLYCQDMGFTCTEKFNITSTYQFECENDSQCPEYFICCPQKCFNHKVCSTGTSKRSENLQRTPESVTSINSQCEILPRTCLIPYSSHLTYRFKCDFDEQCPNGYKCCKQACFTHKICSKNIKDVGELRRTSDTVRNNIELGRKRITPNNIETTQTTTMKVDEDINTIYYEDVSENHDITTNYYEEVSENHDVTTSYYEEVTKNHDENVEPTDDIGVTDAVSENTEDTKTDEEEETTTELTNNSTGTPDPNAIIAEYKDYYEEADEDYDSEEQV